MLCVRCAVSLSLVLIAWIPAGDLSAQRSQKAIRQAPIEGDPMATYRARAAQVARADVVRHFELAKFCAKHKLKTALAWELHVILKQMTDHLGARKMRGEIYHQGRWLPKAAAYKARGFVRHEGTWLPPKLAQAKRRAARHARAVERRADALLLRLADPRSRERRQAHRELEALAKTESMPALARIAKAQAAAMDRYWRRAAPRGRTSYTGILSIQATHSQLLSMRPFTTSLGTGAPVRLHLPQMRTVSIGTTVGVPLGWGR